MQKVYYNSHFLFAVFFLKSLDYKAFHRFGQAKFASAGLFLGLSQFSLLPQLPQIMTLNSKFVKMNSK